MHSPSPCKIYFWLRVQSPTLNLASVQHNLAAVLLLGGRGKHLKHAIYRLVNRCGSLPHPETLRSRVTHIGLDEARVQDEGDEPFVLGIDPNTVPIHHGLGCSVRSIRYRRLTPAMPSSVSRVPSRCFFSFFGFFFTYPRAPPPEPIGAKIGLLGDFCSRLRVAWYSDSTPNTLTSRCSRISARLTSFTKG